MALTKFNFNSFDLTTAAGKGIAFNSSANGLETAAEGSLTLIKTLTASSSSTLSFVDGSSSVVLDNTYPVYLFKFINCHPATNSALLRFTASTDGGSNYGVTKTSTGVNAYNAESFAQAAIGYNTGIDLAQSTTPQNLSTNVSNASDGSTSGVFYLFNPSSTTFVKHFIVRSSLNNGSYAQDEYFAGYLNTTSAIDAIQFKFSSGNIDAGTIKLYGIKDS